MLVRGAPVPEGAALASLFAAQVDRRLELPEDEQKQYGRLLSEALGRSGQPMNEAQYAVIVDRNKLVQAAMIYWLGAEGTAQLVGASPVSTGLPGTYEYFETPLGVFVHTVENQDFRAEGTKNRLGVRGYGEKGRRVYDFGWVFTKRGWGDRREGFMRLQMHATDPDLLEPSLGTARSKGCVRVPATFNQFVDHYGLLDADYERALRAGRKFWVLREDREVTSTPGRYLVVVETQRAERPAWSPAPGKR